MFTSDLLDVLPPQVADKIRRMEADGRDAELLTRAARYLELHGASARFGTHGVRPAHVRPQVEPQRHHVAAVAEIRQRIADIDAYAASLPGKVASGELTELWGDVLATDTGLARLAWERIEERIIADAEDAGIPINRRADLDPAALLEIERA